MQFNSVEDRFHHSVEQLQSTLTTSVSPIARDGPTQVNPFEQYLQALLSFVSFDISTYNDESQRIQDEINDILARLPVDVHTRALDLLNPSPPASSSTQDSTPITDPNLVQIYDNLCRIRHVREISLFWQQPISSQVAQTFSLLLSYALNSHETLRRASLSIWCRFYTSLPTLAVQLFKFPIFVQKFLDAYITDPVDSRYFLYSAPLSTNVYTDLIKEYLISTQLFHCRLTTPSPLSISDLSPSYIPRLEPSISPTTTSSTNAIQIRDVFSYIDLESEHPFLPETSTSSQILSSHYTSSTHNELEIAPITWLEKDQRTLIYIQRGLELGELWYPSLCNSDTILKHFDAIRIRLNKYNQENTTRALFSKIPIITTPRFFMSLSTSASSIATFVHKLPRFPPQSPTSTANTIASREKNEVTRLNVSLSSSLISFLDYKSYYHTALSLQYDQHDQNGLLLKTQQNILDISTSPIPYTSDIITKWQDNNKLEPVTALIKDRITIFDHVIPRQRNFFFRRLLHYSSSLDHLYTLLPVLNRSFIEHDFVEGLVTGFLTHPLILDKTIHLFNDFNTTISRQSTSFTSAPEKHSISQTMPLTSHTSSVEAELYFDKPHSSYYPLSIYQSPEFQIILYIIFNTPIFHTLCDVDTQRTLPFKASEIFNKIIPLTFSLFPSINHRLAILYKLGYQLDIIGLDQHSNLANLSFTSTFPLSTAPAQLPTPKQSVLLKFNYLSSIIPTTLQLLVSLSKIPDSHVQTFFHSLTHSLYALHGYIQSNTLDRQLFPISSEQTTQTSSCERNQALAETQFLFRAIVKGISPRYSPATLLKYLESMMDSTQCKAPMGKGVISRAGQQRKVHIEDEGPLAAALQNTIDLVILDIIIEEN